MFKKVVAYAALIAVFSLISFTVMAQEQGRQLNFSQQFRQAQRIVRIAEPGELADTLNVWGDVNSPGRYLVPKSTNLPELISYSFGPATVRSRETSLNWSKLRLHVKVSRYNEQNEKVAIKTFSYRYDKSEPDEMFKFDLHNNDIVTLQVKRKPAFIDYVRVVAPVVSSVAAGILILDRLQK